MSRIALLLRRLSVVAATVAVIGAGLVVGTPSAGASVINPDLPVPTYQLNMTAVVVGGSMIRVTVVFDHAPDESWGIGSWRTTGDSDIEVSGGPGAGYFRNCYDPDECNPERQDIQWNWDGGDSWTGEITGSFDCTSNYSLYMTAGISHDIPNPSPDWDSPDILHADGYGEAWADITAPDDAVECGATPRPVVGTAQVTEGNAGTTPVNVTVGLDAPPLEMTTVQWHTADQTATAGSDYTAASGTLTFAPGETSKPVALSVVGDRKIEPDESFLVQASSPWGSTQNAIKIVNDEPAVSALGPTVVEGDTGTSAAPVQVSLAAPIPAPTTLNYATSGGTATAASGDYIAASGSITIPANQTTAAVPVSIGGDYRHEANETVGFAVSNVDGQQLAIGVVTISDDDAALAFSAPSVAEPDSGTAPLAFVVTLPRTYSVPVRLRYVTSGGTATSGADYQSTDGVVVIPAGSLSGQLVVPVQGDVTDEADETVGVSVMYDDGSGVSAGTALGTIRDNDAPPTLTVDSPSVAEGNTASPNSLHFTVSLDAPSELPVSFGYQAAPGTAEPVDFIATFGQASIPAGSLSVSIAVRVHSDVTFEGNETVQLLITNPVNAVVGADQGAGVIVNDDIAPKLSVTGAAVVEGTGQGSTLTFKVTSSAVSELPAEFVYSTQDGTAHAGDGDYQATLAQGAVPVGQKSVIVTVPVSGDSMYEANETMKLVIGLPTNARITTTTGVAKATGTIKNDDIAPSMTVSDVQQTEGNSGSKSLVLTVQLSAISGVKATARYATVNDTALAGSDYVAKSGSVAVTPGQSTASIVIAVRGDTMVEPDEIFRVNLSSPAQVSLARTQALATIGNDD